MNHISIKSLLPGCGKSYLLCKSFIDLSLPNSLIITPTNKAAQVNKDKLINVFHMNELEANTRVMTMRMFKQNYVQFLSNGKKEYVPTTTKLKTWKTVYNLFIDEYSMFSDWEINDLVENVPINNIITAGDINQFNPIKNEFYVIDNQNNFVMTSTGVELKVNDDGKPASLPFNTEIILKKSKRFPSNSKLKDFLDSIKNADNNKIIYYINSLLSTKAYKMDDNHKVGININPEEYQVIAYTHRACNFFHKNMKTDYNRFIAINNIRGISVYKGEFYDKCQVEALALQENEFYTEGFNSEKWINYVFKPAYAVNAHRLQGDSINKHVGIFMYDMLNLIAYDENQKKQLLDSAEENKDYKMEPSKLNDDFLYPGIDLKVKKYTEEFEDELNMKKMNIQERIDTFQKFLYVAVSRAMSDDKITFFADFMDKSHRELLESVIRRFKPMVDNFSDNAVYSNSSDIDLSSYIVKNMMSDELDYWKYKWRHTSYDKRCIDYTNRKERSDKGKQHKQHIFNQEELQDSLTMSARKWQEKYGLSTSLWQRAKKEATI